MADRTVRLSQTLAPFGVGAIYDVLGDSFIACETSLWRAQGRPLHSSRLERALRVSGFREAPSRANIYGSTSGVGGIPYFRFPRWMFCTACRQMTFWNPKDEQQGEAARCGHCRFRRQLVPMRFVMACREGHIADVPWHKWAHANAETPDQKQCQLGPLFFRVRPNAGGSLASLFVECGVAKCRATNTLSGITGPGALKRVGVTCRGLQPWQFPKAEAAHDVVPDVLQRGASNVHFARIESALDIPPESDYSDYGEMVLRVTTHAMYPAVISAPDGPLAGPMIAIIAAACSVAEVVVREVIAQQISGTAGTQDTSEAGEEDLLEGEFLAFVAPQSETDARSTFVTRAVDLPVDNLGARQAEATASLTRLFDHVVIATKIREVRALTGFTRIDPGGSVVRPDLGRGLDWLPGLEVFGEGLFLALREDAVRAWESGPAADRSAVLMARRSASKMAFWLPGASPRFLLVHTFAHLLIRQLAFDAGYSSASLRERVYALPSKDGRPGQAGVLIYTAAGDAEGTLGGLARLGEPERLAPSLLALLQRSLWCSNDPICRDSPGQGVGGLNRAACHACALVSETSCGHSNALLDRALVVGSPEIGVSFFESELRLAMSRVASGGT